MTKLAYERPTVEFVGTLETITQSTNSGFILDAAFDGGPEVEGELSDT